MPNINGIAHIALTVTDMKRSVPFYRRLLTGLGLTIVNETERHFYAVGCRTGIAISASEEPYNNESFKQKHPGLHHFCLRARSREDVDEIHNIACEIGAKIIHGPQEDGYAPGYYSVLFEDPDGIRIEANFVPGSGLLEPGRGQVGSAGTTWETKAE